GEAAEDRVGRLRFTVRLAGPTQDGPQEHCLENGWEAHQLGARDRDEYASLMSDLQVAEHCLIRGFRITSPVGRNIEGPRPDLYVQKADARAAIEVFRPRELQSFHKFPHRRVAGPREADIRLDFEAGITLEVQTDV